MKKTHIYLTLLSIFTLLTGCNDSLVEELYKKMVSFKAPINYNEVSRIHLKYDDTEISYKLPVIVSGSKDNKKNINVKIAVDQDTLAILNEEKYANRTDLHYRQLPDEFYELSSDICHIPSGSNKELFTINFNLEGLDLVEKWVLPLTIVDDPSYETNKRKGWRKALLHIIPFNDYSGPYTATGMTIYYGDETDQSMNVATRTTRVVNENTIFFYAGITEEESINRGIYKIFASFSEPVQKEENRWEGTLDVYAENENINFRLTTNPTYEIREEMDATIPYLLHRYITLSMGYTYEDITLIEDFPLKYRCNGSMIMERKINTLIPDEDQAIQW